MAGIIPGTPDPQYTKEFTIDSDAWYGQGEYEFNQDDARMEVLKVYGAAQEYARDLMNPKRFNWVRMEWIYV